MASAQTHPAKRLLVSLTVAVVAFVVLAGLPEFISLLDARARVHAQATEIARRRLDNAALRARIQSLREDPAAIEDVARRELGMFRQGEVLFIIKNVPKPKP